MKKVIRNLCTIALVTGMLLPATSCSSKSKTGDTHGQGSQEANDSDYEGHTESSEKNRRELKNLSKNQPRIIQEDDPFYNSTVVKMLPHTPEGKEVVSVRFQGAVVAGDRVLADIHYQLKMSAATQAEMDELDMSDSSNWGRYQQIEDEHSYDSLQLFDLKGNYLATIPTEAEFTLNQAFPINNDEILVITQKMDWDDCSAVPKLFVISSSGQKIRDVDLGIKDPLYYMNAYSTDNGNLILAGRDVFYLLDQQGKLIKKVEEKNLEGTMYHSDGKFYAAIRHGQTDLCTFREMDCQEGKLVGEEIKVDRNNYVALNNNTDCLIFENDSVQQYSIANGTRNTLVSSVTTDANCYNLIGGKVFSKDHMVFIRKEIDVESTRYDIYCSSEHDNEMSIVTLDRAQTNPNVGKEVLTLGICDNHEHIYFDDIAAYNADPDSRARIEVVEYPLHTEIGYGIFDSVDFLGTASQDFTQDLYSGKGPDIVIGFADLAQLNNENYMLDMKQYLESDASLNDEDYFVNILHAFEKNGKIFSMPITYSLFGAAVNEFYEGAKEKWTYEDLKTMDAKLQSNMESLLPFSGSELLTYWLYASDSDFINYENRTVSFESEEFKAFLEEIKKHSTKERNSQTVTLSDSIEAYINGDCAASNIVLSELQDYCMLTDPKKGYNTGTIFTGIPSQKGTNMCAKGDFSMSISAAASNPDLAWEFIRFFLNEDVQKKLSFCMYSFPVNKKAFEENCQREIEISETIYKEYEKSPSSFGSQPRLITREDADKLASIVSSVERNVSIDSDILKIIVEEADAYIYGFSDIDRVCRIIQLKAQDVIMNR